MIVMGDAYAVYDADTGDQLSSEMTRDAAYAWLGDAIGEIGSAFAERNLAVRLVNDMGAL